jgi:hypothetical protein
MLFATTSARLAVYTGDPERERERIERQLAVFPGHSTRLPT